MYQLVEFLSIHSNESNSPFLTHSTRLSTHPNLDLPAPPAATQKVEALHACNDDVPDEAEAEAADPQCLPRSIMSECPTIGIIGRNPTSVGCSRLAPIAAGFSGFAPHSAITDESSPPSMLSSVTATNVGARRV